MSVEVLHCCHFPGCPKAVRNKQIACRVHWDLLPLSYREALWDAYRRQPFAAKTGVESFRVPSHGYRAIERLCVWYWHVASCDSELVDGARELRVMAESERQIAIIREKTDPFRSLGMEAA